MSGGETVATARAGRRLWQAGPSIVLCALLAGSCSSANAQSWQCHAPKGSFAEQEIAVPANATEFSGEMTIRKGDGLGLWHPTARIAFNDIGVADSGCHCNGILVSWDPAYPDSYVVSLSVDGKATAVGHRSYDKPLKFKLSFNWDGALKLVVGDKVATGTAPNPTRNNLHMSCSSGDVGFNVAVAPPTPPSRERCPFAAQEQWSREDLDRYCKVRG
ncbi:MAG TPA: hypothetical protein VK980_09620 [Sphingomonas sp.]|nr:hypothetical protein [Sphingomonas sp.]